MHSTMHTLEDLGIVTSGARSRGFDGKEGLAQLFTNATKRLGGILPCKDLQAPGLGRCGA